MCLAQEWLEEGHTKGFISRGINYLKSIIGEIYSFNIGQVPYPPTKTILLENYKGTCTSLGMHWLCH